MALRRGRGDRGPAPGIACPRRADGWGRGAAWPAPRPGARLPFDDGSFDLVVSFTGLHCFPDPQRAVREMVRVLRAGGAITGSSMFLGAGWRLEVARRMGTAAGVLGPMCTADQARAWLSAAGCRDVRLAMSGGIGYFRAVRA
ncbi:class I SAM-dependent methyltransferase [Nocardioides gansuensis]|uniref:class I SAM-dependent methyltransferase n=1 Tax=Nocardioides gansuensis TaxID=2138300 RepID=UPI001FE34B59|nr:class I SAM-dependent methyltransferase [Nocardioides gansuensis]